MQRMSWLKLPNLFLLGPAKTATTSMAYYLGQHTDIFISEPKETLFFEFEYEKGAEFYLREYFRHQDEESVIVDGRPMNFVVPYVIHRILEVCPDAKFVVILRHPLIRTYSDWQNWARMRPGRAHKNFKDAIAQNIKSFSLNKFELEGDYVPFCDRKGGSYIPTYIEASLYGNRLSRMFEVFDRDRFLLLDFDDMVKDPQSVVNKVHSHVGLESQTLYDTKERNMTRKSHKTVNDLDVILGQLGASEIIFLKKVFSDDMKILKNIHGIDFINKWEGI